jgi:type III pantothenate kinase
VPALTAPLAEACEQVVGAAPVIIDARSPLPITLDVEEPLTVGADRIINTLAASRIYKRHTIVVDLGTATTYDCITADGVFLGGVIAPGIRTSAETLFRRTSKLPATEIAPPARVIGRRTEECIRSGIVLGGAESIDGPCDASRVSGRAGQSRWLSRPAAWRRYSRPSAGVRDHRAVSDVDRAPHGAPAASARS